MPPSFPTTSSVAVATARILEAYLSNHKLSPAEAASLGGRIADALTGLVENGGIRSQATTMQEPAPKRRAKVRRSDPALPEPAAGMPEEEPESEEGSEPEVDAQPMAEPAQMTADGAPGDPPVPAVEPAEVQQAEVEQLRKRKRPSRPRSRRGQGFGAAAAAEATSGEEPEAEAPHDDEQNGAAADDDGVAVADEASPTPAPIAAEAAAEAPALPAKPRRAASRARRVTAS